MRCLGVDVSRGGLGIVGLEKLEPGTKVLLQTKDHGVTLEVVWCKVDSVKANVFHVGLVCKDVAINLDKLLEAEGLFRERRPMRKQTPEIGFESIRAEIAMMHSYDQGILRKIGMEKFGQTHKAYPISFQGKSLVILISSELKPVEASKLSEDEAAEKVVIVNVGGHQTSKIWPTEL